MAGWILVAALGLGCDRPLRPGREAPRVRQPTSPLEDAPEIPTAAPRPGAIASQHSRGQALYLPVYSSIFTGDELRTLEMTVTVSVRNTAAEPMDLDQVDYVGTKGRLLESVLESPVRLGPLETRDYVIREADARGGTGANFLIHWSAPEPISPPVVQAVHVFLQASHDFAFTTDAVELVEVPATAP